MPILFRQLTTHTILLHMCRLIEEILLIKYGVLLIVYISIIKFKRISIEIKHLVELQAPTVFLQRQKPEQARFPVLTVSHLVLSGIQGISG